MSTRQTFYHPDLIMQHDPLSPIAEAFKIARTNTAFAAIDTDIRTLVFTSCGQAEGKTIAIGNLAIAYAQIGKKVLLVDADLRRPAVHRLFGIPNRVGLTHVLVGRAEPEAAIQPTATRNLSIMASGPIPPNPTELLMSHHLDELVQAMKETYDLILFDCPPVGPVTDAAILANKADGTILIIRSGRVEKKNLVWTLDLLKQVKARVLGYILNGVTPQNSNYAYEYGYYEYGRRKPDAKTRKKRAAPPANRRPDPPSPSLRRPNLRSSGENRPNARFESNHD